MKTLKIKLARLLLKGTGYHVAQNPPRGVKRVRKETEAKPLPLFEGEDQT